MDTKVTNVVLLGLIAFAFAVGAWAYPSLPEEIASHWNAAGEADDYMPKLFGVFLFPAIMLILFAIFWVIPKIDPLRANIESFRRYYNAFWVFLFAFFLYVYGLMLAWNLGLRFDFTVAMIPAIAALFYGIGIMLERSKRNWFVGIRTPWTLSSDVVWEKTHKLGGKLFRIVAIISLAGLFFRGEKAILFVVLSAVAVALITIVYSFLEYRKLKN